MGVGVARGGEERDRGTGGVQWNYVHEPRIFNETCFPPQADDPCSATWFGLYRIGKDEEERKIHGDKAQSVQCSAVQCSAVQCSAVQYSTSCLSERQPIPQILPQ